MLVYLISLDTSVALDQYRMSLQHSRLMFVMDLYGSGFTMIVINETLVSTKCLSFVSGGYFVMSCLR